MEQLVILIIVGVVGLIQWLIKRSNEMRERQEIDRRLAEQGGDRPRGKVLQDYAGHEAFETNTQQAEQDAGQEIQESMKRLMQAFGMSEEEVREVPETPVFVEPPLPAAAPVTSKQSRAEAKQPKVRQGRLRSFKVPKIAAPAFAHTPAAVAVVPGTTRIAPSVTTTAQSPWKQRLAQPQSVREAIVFAEILGSPRALR